VMALWQMSFPIVDSFAMCADSSTLRTDGFAPHLSND